mgnify:CR=1 FL=1
MMQTTYERKAHYYETDQMGIIHHANYIRWFEEARLDYMDRVGFTYARAEECGIYIPVLAVVCEYKSIVRFAETVMIHTAVTSFNGVRMTVGYRVCGKQDGVLHATGESRHCFMNKNNRPVSLKKALPELYDKITENVIKEDIIN